MGATRFVTSTGPHSRPRHRDDGNGHGMSDRPTGVVGMTKGDRASRIARLEAGMGSLPTVDRQPPPYVVIDEVSTEQYLRQEIEYHSEPDAPATPAFLLVPHSAAEAPAPAALSLHGTNLDLGHRTTVGLGGRPGRDYGHRLAEYGFVVLAPAYPTMGGYDPDFLGLGYASGTMKAIVDNIRGIDLLTSLPSVAGDRVAAIGHSLGGHNALFTAGFDERIAALAVSCSFDSFVDYQGGDVTAWLQDRYMPRLLDAGSPPFDFDDVLALVADRALFVSAPIGDANFQWWSTARLVSQERTERSAALELLHPNCGHEFPYDLQDRAFRFLAEALANR